MYKYTCTNRVTKSRISLEQGYPIRGRKAIAKLEYWVHCVTHNCDAPTFYRGQLTKAREAQTHPWEWCPGCQLVRSNVEHKGKIVIHFEGTFTPEVAERLEDGIATYLGEMGLKGKIEDEITGNTTVFPIEDEPLVINVGDRVKIYARGTTRTGTVLSAVNYGTDVDPNWYIEIQDETAYWKQEIDGGWVVRL